MNSGEIGNARNGSVLILHGWTLSGHDSWLPVAEQLSTNGISSTLIDLPGFGKSPAPTDIWGAQDYATHVAEWIRDTNKSFDAIVGHSFGGAVASQIASSYPSMVKKLVLVAPAIVREPASVRTSRLSNPFFSPLKTVYRVVFGSRDYNQSKGIMKDIMKRVIHEDLSSSLQNISSNTLLIWGTEDTYTPYKYAQLVSEGINGSELKTYQGINHGIHLHANNKLVDDITTFIATT